MRIVKVYVDFLFADEDQFVCRYVWQGYKGTLHESTGPVYGKVLPSGSVQLYDINEGSIRKAGNRVVSADRVDFSHALVQSALPPVTL